MVQPLPWRKGMRNPESLVVPQPSAAVTCLNWLSGRRVSAVNMVIVRDRRNRLVDGRCEAQQRNAPCDVAAGVIVAHPNLLKCVRASS